MPEISHRCPACGVSIRDAGERVMFCPECGKALASDATEQDENEKRDSQGQVPEPPISVWPTVAGESDKPGEPSAGEKPANREDEERRSTRERTREKLQRASQRTRGAIEDNVKRVEKIHHVSSVVLEEATYDPSLRFVLVALGLFVLAVVLLVLSKVMG